MLISIVSLAIFELSLAATLKEVAIPGIPVTLPISENAPDDIPSNGVCIKEEGLACEDPGAKVAYEGPDCCYECVCEEDTVVCCRTVPLPHVKNPRHCTMYLDP
ncbi:hypothetical protein, partial [Salmonella sp. s54395]|uniref:hypothetical protein n=1 Tax=Salmonella sp. s54395 TaxID=3159664 RepID=UPI00397EADA4